MKFYSDIDLDSVEQMHLGWAKECISKAEAFRLSARIIGNESPFHDTIRVMMRSYARLAVGHLKEAYDGKRI